MNMVIDLLRRGHLILLQLSKDSGMKRGNKNRKWKLGTIHMTYCIYHCLETIKSLIGLCVAWFIFFFCAVMEHENNSNWTDSFDHISHNWVFQTVCQNKIIVILLLLWVRDYIKEWWGRCGKFQQHLAPFFSSFSSFHSQLAFSNIHIY